MASQIDPGTQTQSRMPLTQDGAAGQSRIILSHSIKTVRPAGDRWAQPDRREERIAVAAYYLAERRRFEPGHEHEDWLAAEAQISALESNRDLT